MPAQTVEIVPSDDDEATRRLARILLVCEIAGQILACYALMEMVNHGEMGKFIAWHWRRFTTSLRPSLEEQYRRDLGRVLYEAGEIIRSSPHG
jgi:hypothetical protein